MENTLDGWQERRPGRIADTISGPRYSAVDWVLDRIAPCPWTAMAGSNAPLCQSQRRTAQPLYTPEQRTRRDSTRWTLVQGILAPVQFAVFAVSLVLILRYLATGTGYPLAAASVVAKTLVLYLIMVTGSIWEKKVFGKYLFAPAFYWEDMVSMIVIALHTLYLLELFSGAASAQQLMILAIAAYTTYVVNAAQFVLKLRAARLEHQGGHTLRFIGHGAD